MVELLQREIGGGGAFADCTGVYSRPAIPPSTAAEPVAFKLTENFQHTLGYAKARKLIWQEDTGEYIPDPEVTEEITVWDTRRSWPDVPKDTGGEARVRMGPDGEIRYEITDLFCYAANL